MTDAHRLALNAPAPRRDDPALVPAFPFDRDRFRHDLVRQTGRVCLVARTNLVTGSLHWEVVVLRYQAATTWHGCALPEQLRYPGTNSWGQDGWTYTTLADAEWRVTKTVTRRNEDARI
jgi:hypothetical protein